MVHGPPKNRAQKPFTLLVDIGLGIIGPGAEERHIEPRLEPHARAAVNAVVTMNNL